jgi:subtilase family serine protease
MLRLVIGLKPPHPEEEQKFLDDLQDKTSPEFHHFLTADEWNARFGPSVEDERTVADWAQSQGMTITNRYANRLLVDIEAPSATIEKAFNVTINNYQLGTKQFFSNDRDPVVPQGLSTIVESIGGLNNLNVLHPASKNAVEPSFANYTAGPVHADGKSGSHSSSQKPPDNISNGLSPNMTGGAYDPTDIFSSQAYDANALYAFGHCCNPLGNPGVTPPETSIAIATAGTQNGADFTGFHNQYPYLADHWQQFYIDGTPACCDTEGTMDMEWSTAMSNSFGSYVDTAMVYLYDGVNANFSTFNDIYNHILNDGKARVFSTS